MRSSNTVPAVVLLGCLPWLPESPKFLIGKGKFKEATNVMAAYEPDQEAIQVSTFASLCFSCLLYLAHTDQDRHLRAHEHRP